MPEPYVGEIRIFAGNFAPAGWMFCDGQTLPISQNDVLFQLIGTTYGGDGEETFNLPNLQSRIPIHMGQGPGIANNYQIGEAAGVESVTLSIQQIPVHNHAFIGTTDIAQTPQPQDLVPAQAPTVQTYYNDVGQVAMAANAVQPVGGSQPHDNLMPYICINYILSLYGVYPNPT